MGSIEVNGVEVAIKTPTDGQIAAMGRFAQVLASDNIEGMAKMTAYLRVSDILLKLVGEDDKPAVESALEEGTVTLQGIMQAALKADAATTTTVRRGRGRPRKSA